MNQVRTFNVLTLASILLLAGCFGLGDSAEAETSDDDHDHTPNAAPVVSVMQTDGFDCDSGTCEGSLYHAVVDPDGDVMTSGWDTDLDGTIDIQITSNRGYSDISINQQEWEEIEDGDIFTTIAFIAVDSNDAATAELLTVYAYDESDSNSGGGLDLYQFDNRDAANEPDMSANGGDALVHVSMTQGSSLSWSLLEVSIVVDGGTSNKCVEPADADEDGLKCTYSYVVDSAWTVAEEITIFEGANGNLCDGVEGYCEVNVTLTKIGVGSAPDAVIAMFTAVASA
jgi:hypothetical protein